MKLGSDGVDFESLSEVLKNPTRRRIILSLSDKGGSSYVDLMNSVEITNTGKFDYHLKILGDLIEKDENGKVWFIGKRPTSRAVPSKVR